MEQVGAIARLMHGGVSLSRRARLLARGRSAWTGGHAVRWKPKPPGGILPPGGSFALAEAW